MYNYKFYDNNQLINGSYDYNYLPYSYENEIENKHYITINNEKNWYIKFNNLKNYIAINDRLPGKKTILGGWLNTQRKYYKLNKGSMLNNIIYNEWKNFINDRKYKKYFIIHVEKWYNDFIKLKNFIDLNNKSPSKETNLGKWLQSQKNNYRTKKNNMLLDENVFNTWKKFINDDNYKELFICNGEEEWYKNFNDLKNFIDINDKLPYYKSNLGKWLGAQKYIYKLNKNIMKNKTIRNEWENFINNDKYKNFFINYKECWYNNLNELKEYIDIIGALPHKKSYLGNWLYIQMNNYDLNKDMMKNKTIWFEWRNFINDDKYKNLFLSRNKINYLTII